MPTSQPSRPFPPTTPAQPSATPTPNLPLRRDPSEAGKRGPLDTQEKEVPSSGGPRTPEGKAVSARNATTHGLFCRQTVLPHLGEDADGYKKLLDVLFEQFDPRTLMERQYLELWAEASWKLRRLSRWEAQLWEQDDLDEDGRLGKLERVMRLQTTLRRQLDKAVRMLSRDVPDVQQHYARRAVLASRSLTETDCREDPALAYSVEVSVQAEIAGATGLAESDRAKLDAAIPDPPHENCQNEPPAPNLPTIGESLWEQERPPLKMETCSLKHRENCQNELPPTWTASSPSQNAQHGSYWPLSLSEGGGVPDEGGVGAT